MKHWNEDSSIVLLSYTFYVGLLVQWNTGMKTATLWCSLIHFIWDSCPMKHWNEDSSIVMLSYTFYMGFLSNETLEWRQLHCDAVLYILYWILVQWNTWMKTAPLWCCLIHFILDYCPMKHWNEDTSIVMLSYTFYMGFLSNEVLEWRHLHCDAVLYILYGILVQWSAGMKTATLWCCLIHFILDCVSNETLEWWQLHCDVVIHFIWDSCPLKCWNEDTSIVMLSYTFYIGFLSNETLEWRQLHCDAVLYILYGILVQWNTGMKTAPLWCCLIHFILDSCPMKHLNEDSSIVMLSYTFYIGLLFQWNTGMMTAPLWCCLIHFILDYCPMKHWNEDSSIVMLSYTFYMGFLSNEVLEWRHLHCDAVLYILYGILVQWSAGMKTATLWCCLIHFILDCLSNETLEWWQLHCDAVLYILYGILVQWSAGMKTPPLWCCLIHFILDSCPMKHWNEDSCIVMLSYTF